MKKVGVAGSLILVFIFYAMIHHNSVVTIPVSTNRSSGLSANTNTSVNNGIYKDGTYTGSAADAFYGTIQVKATIQNGKLTDVQFLQYPNDRDQSVQINQQAMPMLKQEALVAQSSQVDIVSGATDSSQAFMQSLAFALTQAK